MKFPKKILIAVSCAATAVSLYFAFSTPAHAEGPFCGTHDQVSKSLSDKYKETSTGIGLVSATAMIEIYVSKSGTFTLVRTQSDGLSCVVFAGADWQSMKPDFGPSY